MSKTLYESADGTVTSREESGGVALDLSTVAGVGRNSIVHMAVHNGGSGAQITVIAAEGVHIVVLPNGVGEPLFERPPVADQA